MLCLCNFGGNFGLILFYVKENAASFVISSDFFSGVRAGVGYGAVPAFGGFAGAGRGDGGVWVCGAEVAAAGEF